MIDPRQDNERAAEAKRIDAARTDSTRLDPDNDANRDPISGTPGAHPVGAGVGAAGAGAAGAAIGAVVGGPVGAVAGAVIGGIAGGLGGKAAAEAVNPTIEDRYWRVEYKNRPYVDSALGYDDYGPAYKYGWENYDRVPFDRKEMDLQRGWEKARGNSRLEWDRAKAAVRDSWDRLERALPGDADRDGR